MNADYDDTESEEGTVDLVAGVFLIIVMVIASLYVLQSNITHAYQMHASRNTDKIETSYEIEPYAFDLTAYQTYMLGFLMDTQGPTVKSGVTFVHGDKTLTLSPDTFNYNYTTRNQMITGHSGNSVYSIIGSSGYTGNELVNYYRGLTSGMYHLELNDMTTEYKELLTPDGTRILETNRKEYLWTLYGQQ